MRWRQVGGHAGLQGGRGLAWRARASAAYLGLRTSNVLNSIVYNTLVHLLPTHQPNLPWNESLVSLTSSTYAPPLLLLSFILLLTITRNTHLTLKRPWILQNHASFCFRLSAVGIMEVKFIYFPVPIWNIFFLFNPAYRCHLVKNVISVPIVTSSITFLKFPGLSFMWQLQKWFLTFTTF